ncbi:sigma-70 family RNA polymerase sigma factor [Streptomyces liangshanensis]|uniref:Sigma-70 family RNA polymerase sigma factor n=1 Tax=Streptomyces liangshanensis TaxID=2717324 RepID=A0A6G9H6Y8_9ACTN|nr:sigma-70 family RNA polymerase sigma factor [Streptomyces liangshanensis]QIQ06315.1 sigma-70 family RNA polymerase sigma factor [Streptomyces liangshanensis]
MLAARGGDPRALDALVAAGMPLIYNIVGRALDGHSDVDDVVQETLVRIVRGLPGLRDPDAFRSWAVAIAVRQVRDREQHRAAALDRTASLEAADHVADPSSDFASVTILRLGLTDQRREVAEATRWLDEDDRTLLSLWWLEATGEVSRTELAEALGLSGRHAAVRVQRLREQIEVCRGIVRALAADTPGSGCPGLGSLTERWPGEPGPLWRKRFARHLRACDVCGVGDDQRVPVERLLGGLPLLPLPADAVSWSASASAGLTPDAGAAHGVTVVGGDGGTGHGTGGRAGRRRAARKTVQRRRGLTVGLGAGAVAAAAALVVAFLPGGSPAKQNTVTTADAPAAVVPATSSAPPKRSASPSASVSPSPKAKTKAKPKPTPSTKPTRRAAAPPPRTAAVASARKGVGVWNWNGGATKALGDSGAGWYYTWGTDHSFVSSGSAQYVPMIWGKDSVDPANLARARAAGPYLLGFNEPDMGAQSNMTVDQALALWPKVQDTGKIVGSPAVAFGGDTAGGWLDRFMSGAKSRGYRVDFVTLHWYGGDFRTEAAVGQLRSYIEAVHARYGKPVWLTEFALTDFSQGTPRFPTEDQQAAFLASAAKMLAGLPYVQRWAWFGLPAADSGPSTGLYRSGPAVTPAGRAFRDAR